MKVHDFHDGNRQLQDKFGTRKLADNLAKRATETLGVDERKFIEGANMFFLATCDERGLPTCSYKGGEPGFVRVVDEKTIAFPNYDGLMSSSTTLMSSPTAARPEMPSSAATASIPSLFSVTFSASRIAGSSSMMSALISRRLSSLVDTLPRQGGGFKR